MLKGRRITRSFAAPPSSVGGSLVRCDSSLVKPPLSATKRSMAAKSASRARVLSSCQLGGSVMTTGFLALAGLARSPALEAASAAAAGCAWRPRLSADAARAGWACLGGAGGGATTFASAAAFCWSCCCCCCCCCCRRTRLPSRESSRIRGESSPRADRRPRARASSRRSSRSLGCRCRSDSDGLRVGGGSGERTERERGRGRGPRARPLEKGGGGGRTGRLEDLGLAARWRASRMRSQDCRVGSGDDPRADGSRLPPPPSSRLLRKKEPLRLDGWRPRGSSDWFSPSTMAANPWSSLVLSFFFSFDL